MKLGGWHTSIPTSCVGGNQFKELTGKGLFSRGTGHWSDGYLVGDDGLTHTFCLLLTSMIGTETNLQELDVQHWSADSGLRGVHVHDMVLKPEQWAQLKPRFTNLVAFRLCVGLEKARKVRGSCAKAGHWISALIRPMPSLTDLSVVFDDWLTPMLRKSSPIAFQHFARSTNHKQIRKLNLANIFHHPIYQHEITKLTILPPLVDGTATKERPGCTAAAEPSHIIANAAMRSDAFHRCTLQLRLNIVKPHTPFRRFERLYGEMVRHGKDFDVICAALHGLPSLTYINIGEWRPREEPRISSSAFKTKDSAQRLLRGIRRNNSRRDHPFTHRFSAILTALAATQIPIQRLKARHWRPNLHGRHIRVEDIILEPYFIQSLRPALNKLSLLHLSLESPKYAVNENCEEWLTDITQMTPSLRDLTLQLRPDYHEESIYIISRAFRKFVHKADFRHLYRLHLQKVYISFDVLAHFLLTHGTTLRQLSLETLTLTVQTHPGIAVPDTATDTGPSCWVEFIG